MTADTDRASALDAWKALRGLVEQTQAWPVLTGGDQIQDYIGHEPYLRFGVSSEEIANVAHSEPARRAQNIHDVQPGEDWPGPPWLDLTEEPPRMPTNGYEWPEALQQQSNVLQERMGLCPTSDEFASAVGPDGQTITSLEVAERWIHDWITKNVSEDRIVAYWSTQQLTAVDLAFQDSRTIVLLPLARPEAAAALDHYRLHGKHHMHLLLARLIQDWHILWGAEPVHDQGVSLIFQVERPPTTIAEALPLAIELAAIGPYQLDGPGYSIYEFAYTLVGNPTWDLLDLP